MLRQAIESVHDSIAKGGSQEAAQTAVSSFMAYAIENFNEDGREKAFRFCQAGMSLLDFFALEKDDA